MSGRAKFVHWQLSPFDDIPSEPMFNITACPEKPDVVGSTLCGGTLMTTYGISLPLFPDQKTWQRETGAKRKCFRCWASLRGTQADYVNHLDRAHNESALRKVNAEQAIRHGQWNGRV